MLEHEIKNPSKCLFSFPLEAVLWIKEVGDGRFGGRFKIIAFNSGLNSLPEF